MRTTSSKAKPSESSSTNKPVAAGLFGDDDEELFADEPVSKPPEEPPIKEEEESAKPVKKKPAGAVALFGMPSGDPMDLFSGLKKKSSLSDSGKFGDSTEKGDMFTSMRETEESPTSKKQEEVC